MTIGVVAALAGEARALDMTAPSGERAQETLLRISGVGTAAATHAAEELIRAGAHALLSWGVAGGLDPDLPTGAICLPATILDAGGRGAPGPGAARSGTGEGAVPLERLATSDHWRAAFLDALAAQPARLEGAPLSEGALLSGTSAALASVAAKRAALESTGAVAIDMESGAVARVARDASLPFIAVRVIIDAFDDEIPAAVVRASRSGRVQMTRLLGGLLLAPAEVLGLLRLARRYGIATRRLRAVASLRPPLPGRMAALPPLEHA